MDQPVTVTFVPGQVLAWIIIGIIAGFLAGWLIRRQSFGLVRSVVVGLIGALVGGFLFTILRIPVPTALNASLQIRLIDIVVAFLGAVIVLLIANILSRRRVV